MLFLNNKTLHAKSTAATYTGLGCIASSVSSPAKKKDRILIQINNHAKLPIIHETKMIRLTRLIEIDEWGHHFRTWLRTRVARNGRRWHSIKRTTKTTSPTPLIEFTESVEVSPTVLAPRQEVTIQSVQWWFSVLVLGCEGSHCQAP